MLLCARLARLLLLALVVAACGPTEQRDVSRGKWTIRKVGRLRTIGMEVGISTNASLYGLDGMQSGGAAIDTTFARSGASSLKCLRFGGLPCYYQHRLYSTDVPAAGVTSYCRAYYYLGGWPTITRKIFTFLDSTGGVTLCSVRLTPTGTLQLWSDLVSGPGPVQIGSDSDPIPVQTWNRIEVSRTAQAATSDISLELRVNGVSVASILHDTRYTDTTQNGAIRVGWVDASESNVPIWVDDIAWNTSAGTTQNTFPGEGKIVLLKPVSDGAIGSWVAGGGGTTSLFDAIDNTPPIGSATQTNTSQIHNSGNSGATNTGTWNCQAYQDAGIQPQNVINIVQAVCIHGEAIATGTKIGSLALGSNPTGSVTDTFNYGNDAGALGTYDAGWMPAFGTPEISPNVDITAQPTIVIGKTDTTTREADVCFAGILVEYVPQPVMTSNSRMLFSIDSE